MQAVGVSGRVGVAMAGLMDSHVRPGLAKSEGAKHKTVAAAFSDILDNAPFHGEAFEGATHVKLVLGQANPFLKVRSERGAAPCAACEVPHNRRRPHRSRLAPEADACRKARC